MTNFTASQTKSFFLVSFCVLSFLISNAQKRDDRHEHGVMNHNQRDINRISPRNDRPERHPPINYNQQQPPVHSAAPSPAHSTPGVNRDFRKDRANAGRGGYIYNNGYRYHYNNRTPVYSAHNPSWRYRYIPARRTVIASFPFAYETINYGGCGYRYYNGAFYRPYNNAFIVVAPPIGLFIHVLPFGCRRIYVNNYSYYYYNGTYYDQYQDNYRVVAPPVGAVVESLPQGYEKMTIDGETYYKVDGVQYKPEVQDNGEIWYRVIKVD